MDTVGFWVALMQIPVAGVLFPVGVVLVVGAGIRWLRHATN